MVEPTTIMGDVRHFRDELRKASDRLLAVQQSIDALEKWYQAMVDAHELSLLQRSEEEEGYRLPSEALRLKLARAAIREVSAECAERLGLYDELHRERKRGEQRIRDLKVIAELSRSILSAEKEGIV